LRKEAAAIAGAGLLGAVLCAPQAYFFAEYHMRQEASQTGGFLAAASGAAQALFVNAGIFPLSSLGAASALATLAALALIVREKSVRLLREEWVFFLLAAAIGMVACGISVKFRNLTPLVPVLLLIIVANGLRLKARRAALASIAALALVNFAGAANVVAHRDTSKGSWNLPVAEVQAAVRETASRCGGNLVIALHDQVLEAALPGYRLIGPYVKEAAAADFPRKGECFMAVLTYRGAIPKPDYDRMLGGLPGNPAHIGEHGKDCYAATKRRLAPDIPDFYVRILDFGRLEEARALPDWLPAGSIQAQSGEAVPAAE